MKTEPLRCDFCGRFVKYEEAHFDFTPDSEFGPEESTTLCAACDQKEYEFMQKYMGYNKSSPRE